MESGRCALMPRARTIRRGLGRGIDGSPGAPTPRLRRGELHVDELVDVPRNARAQERVNPWPNGGVIGEETSIEPSAPPVVRELQGKIVPSPLDLDEDPGEWIVSERRREGHGKAEREQLASSGHVHAQVAPIGGSQDLCGRSHRIMVAPWPASRATVPTASYLRIPSCRASERSSRSRCRCNGPMSAGTSAPRYHPVAS